MGNLVNCSDAEIITNGTFEDATDWVLGANWSIVNKAAFVSFVLGNPPTLMNQVHALDVDETYQVEFDVPSIFMQFGSAIRVTLGGGSADISAGIETPGHKVIYLKYTAGALGLIFFFGPPFNAQGNATIDNVKMSKIETAPNCNFNLNKIEGTFSNIIDAGGRKFNVYYGSRTGQTGIILELQT